MQCVPNLFQLLQEFMVEVNSSEHEAISRWKTVVDKMITLYKDKGLPYIEGTLGMPGSHFLVLVNIL